MNLQASSSLKYRADIDGLRAVAVLLVVGFHAFPSVITGGFIGVDVFFVISGFLITGIILHGLSAGTFSFIDFYARRTRRIFPTLIVVLLASWAMGWAVLQSDEYSRLLKHAGSGAAFVLNYVLASEGGYFDRVAESKPLLHLWSLGVEEQFYALWPFVLWCAWRLRQKLWLVIVLLCLVSFIWNLVNIQTKPIDTFYALQTRLWELMLGAGLAYINIFKPKLLPQTATTKTLSSTLGLALIGSGVMQIDSTSAFPGWWALLPTIGAALLIASQSDGFINRRLLSLRWMVWVGLISFPMYLWHWPVFAFARIYYSSTPSYVVRIALIALSLILATLTYVAIEKPIRIRFKTNKVAAFFAAALMLIAALSFYQYSQPVVVDAATQNEKAKFYSYFADAPPMRWLTFFEKEFRHDCNFYQIDEYYAARPTNKPKANIAPDCFTPDPLKRHRVLIWGDSHAQMLNSGLAKTLPSDWQLMQIASSGCAARVDHLEQTATDYCAYSNRFALNTIEKVVPDVVIVAQSNGHNLASMNRVATTLEKLGVKSVLFLGPSPHWQDDLPKIIIRRLWPNIPERTWVGVNREVFETNTKLKNRFSTAQGKTYVDVIDAFCNSDGCLTRLGDDAQRDATSWDYGHLTAAASEYFAKQILVPQILRSVSRASE